jgi:hypothetical protein
MHGHNQWTDRSALGTRAVTGALEQGSDLIGQ